MKEVRGKFGGNFMEIMVKFLKQKVCKLRSKNELFLCFHSLNYFKQLAIQLKLEILIRKLLHSGSILVLSS